MKKKVLLLAAVLVASVSFSQKKVLWIGNSYTAFNNLPGLTDEIANSLGDDIEYDSNTPGGNTFLQHSDNPTTYAKIHSNDWDVVVLQAQSQEPSFPDAQVAIDTYAPAAEMNDSIQTILTCAETMFYMTWGRENGDPQWGPISTFEGMNERLVNAYTEMSNDNDASVAPVGVAWKYIRDNYPSIQLYTGDGSHPSYAGSYLAASVFYANIFKKRVEPATFEGTLDATTAAILRRAADSTVFDGDYLQWQNGSHNLAHFDYNQTGNSVNFIDESIGNGLTYKWLFGDGNESTDSAPTHAYTQNGDYEVSLITYSSCGNDTITDSVYVTTVGIDELDYKFDVWQSNPGELNINSSYSGIIKAELIGLDGKVIISTRGSGQLVLNTAYHGIGTLRISSENGVLENRKVLIK